jgi:hypothetical protein
LGQEGLIRFAVEVAYSGFRQQPICPAIGKADGANQFLPKSAVVQLLIKRKVHAYGTKTPEDQLVSHAN